MFQIESAVEQHRAAVIAGRSRTCGARTAASRVPIHLWQRPRVSPRPSDEKQRHWASSAVRTLNKQMQRILIPGTFCVRVRVCVWYC